MRSLQDRRAALTWQVIAQQGGGTLAALDTVLAAVSDFGQPWKNCVGTGFRLREPEPALAFSNRVGQIACPL